MWSQSSNLRKKIEKQTLRHSLSASPFPALHHSQWHRKHFVHCLWNMPPTKSTRFSQQQSKYSPAYVLFKARTTSFTTSVKCTFSPGLTLHYQLLALMAVWGIQWCNSLKTKHEQPWKGVRAGKQIFFTIWSPHIYPTSSTAASPHLIYISALAKSFPLYGSVVCHTFPHPSTAPFPWWRGKEQVSVASVPFG